MDLQYVPQWPPLVRIRVQVLQAQVMPSMCTRGLGECQVCTPIVITSIHKTRSMEFQILCIADAADTFVAYRLSTSKKSNAAKGRRTEKAIPWHETSYFSSHTFGHDDTKAYSASRFDSEYLVPHDRPRMLDFPPVLSRPAAFMA